MFLTYTAMLGDGPWHESHFLLVSLIVTVGLQYSAFIIAYLCQFDLITDFVGSLNFLICALLPLVLNGRYTWEQVTLAVLVCICRLWLGFFLLIRVFRRGKDARFDSIRRDPLHFFVFWTLQIAWIFVVSFGAAFVAGDLTSIPTFSAWHACGFACYAVGFSVQVVADVQKLNFKNNSTNDGLMCTTGIWRYSRHPNYFGEILIWWGIFFACVPALQKSEWWGWFSVASPILTMVLLLFVSGINLSEGQNLSRFATKERDRKLMIKYQESTSPLLPFPPQLYRKLTRPVKTVFFLDFPMYRYAEADANNSTNSEDD